MSFVSEQNSYLLVVETRIQRKFLLKYNRDCWLFYWRYGSFYVAHFFVRLFRISDFLLLLLGQRRIPELWIVNYMELGKPMASREAQGQALGRVTTLRGRFKTLAICRRVDRSQIIVQSFSHHRVALRCVVLEWCTGL